MSFSCQGQVSSKFSLVEGILQLFDSLIDMHLLPRDREEWLDSTKLRAIQKALLHNYTHSEIENRFRFLVDCFCSDLDRGASRVHLALGSTK